MENLQMNKLYNKKYNANKEKGKTDIFLISQGRFKLNKSILNDYINNKILTGVVQYKIFKDRKSRDLILKFYNISEIVYRGSHLATKPYSLFRREYSICISRYFFEVNYYKILDSVISDLDSLYKAAVLCEAREVGRFETLDDLSAGSDLQGEFAMMGLNCEYNYFIRSRLISVFSSKDRRII